MPVIFKQAPLVAAIALAMATSSTHTQAQTLEKIVITAQKRTESLQEVPISVTAIHGDKLESAGIANMSSLADYVPNLFITNAAVNTNIYMRGMGSGNNQAFEQSVGMYIDGIYMGRGRQYRSPFMDVERVEVLRGPQGTLFGKNTVAGAINVTTASPDVGDELNGSIAVAAEQNDGKIVEGYVSGSATDNLALRFGGKWRETGGYLKNVYLNTDEPALEEVLYRFTAVWQPIDSLDINFKYSHSDYDRVGAPSSTKLFLDAEGRARDVPNASAFAGIAYAVVDNFFPDFAAATQDEFTTYKDNNLGLDGDGQTAQIGKNPEISQNETDNLVLKVDWDLQDMLFTSITGWSSYNSLDGVDIDWLPLQFISRDDDQEFEQFSQEFRITSPGGEFFDYVAGVYYEQSDLEFDRRVDIDTNFGGLTPQLIGIDNLMIALSGGQYSANQIARTHGYQLDSSSWAVFGQGTFNISDSFRVTVGLRYTEEDKEVDTFQFLSDSVTGMDTASNNTFLTTIWAETFNSYNYQFNEERATDKWLPSLNVQWDALDSAMLYFSYSQGFKSGGFTSADDGEPAGYIAGQAPDPINKVFTDPADAFEFDDEEVDAFEFGGKHTLLDGGMTLNWAAFYTEYDNLQVSVFKGVGFGVTNAASTIVQGIEVDLNWQATDDLRLGASGGWLDAEFDKYPTAPCTAIQLDVDQACGTPAGFTDNDLSGQETTYAPEYTASLFFDYITDSGIEGMAFFAGGELNYSDDFSPTGDNDPLDRIDSYSKTNLRLGLRGESWEVMAFGRNIFNEEVFSESLDVPVLAGSHFKFVDEGAVFGVRFKYDFY